ncbi:GntR family transcriptional regulator [Halalkalibacillus sediminis]|uniref:GntR family transcriptional regulator n=1 Tax=Halalkalibacillus sediminis TaxID=2018042 RepID=A0A2I0QSH6_9BACI|nr:GntR family transcriptional regulator [Halalkalibacillus sediminis]PKR77305.1 GntR family transcriptional regulator [Halalkalibacillus sediminis]
MELPIRLSHDSKEPFYHQIEEQLKALISSGQLKEDTPLPSIRALSKDLEVSVITTKRAYQNLEVQGFIRTAQGKGTFVKAVDQTEKDEAIRKQIHQSLEEAVSKARSYQFSKNEVFKIIDEIYESFERRNP